MCKATWPLFDSALDKPPGLYQSDITSIASLRGDDMAEYRKEGNFEKPANTFNGIVMLLEHLFVVKDARVS